MLPVEPDNALVFPQLIREREKVKEPWGRGECYLYRLDWDSRDSQVKLTGFLAGLEPRQLPDPYEAWLRSLRFALSETYLNEIGRNALRAQIERSISRPFDTAVRDMCVKTAVAHVNVAMGLLNDCVYDPASDRKSKRYHGPRQDLIKPALLYRFWQDQTGGGIVPYNAGLDRLNNLLDPLTGRFSPEEASEVQSFLDAIEAHREHWKKLWEEHMDTVISITED